MTDITIADAELGMISVRNATGHRCLLHPKSDISGQPKDVKNACKELWTKAVCDAYQVYVDAGDD